MFGLGPTELIVILVLGLLVLGPERIPSVATSFQGVEGLKLLRATYAKEIQYHDNSPVSPEVIDATRWSRIDDALNFVAQQKDAWSQGAPLFWFNNIEAAKAAAKKAEKPILSLRLLGKLTDEFSCANSRFFRAALYANTDVVSR